MSDFATETIEIINAIRQYIDKHGNKELIDKFYQTHGPTEALLSI